MGIRQTQAGTAENTVISAVLIVVIVIVVAAIMWPVFARTGGHGHGSSCQSNLKELTTALILYEGDYNGLLPSSALTGSKTWHAGDFARFATKHGDWFHGSGPPTWPSLLQPYLKSKERIWCPGRRRTFLLWELAPAHDPVSDSPDATVSYWYKAAIDRAWFGDTDANGKWACRKEADFGFPADVIVFYEHLSRHWGGHEEMGLSDGVPLNCGYLDGHVATKRLKDAGNPVGKTDPAAPGEPAWFSYDYKNGKALGSGRFFDGRTCGDNLP